GGTVWDSIVYDPEARLVYVGTGNGAPWNQRVRSPGGGDNLYLSSILALDVDTGELVWHYQTTPGDTWDYTAVQPLMLAELDIDGRERKVIMQAPKNGSFYVLDRLTGELLSAEAYTRVTWAKGIDLASGRPIQTGPARSADLVTMISPRPGGGHNWHPLACNQATALAGSGGRSQLAPDVVPSGHWARLPPGLREQLRLRGRLGLRVPSARVERRDRPRGEHGRRRKTRAARVGVRAGHRGDRRCAE